MKKTFVIMINLTNPESALLNFNTLILSFSQFSSLQQTINNSSNILEIHHYKRMSWMKV